MPAKLYPSILIVVAVLVTAHKTCTRTWMVDTNRTVGYKEPLDTTRLLLYVNIKSGQHQCALH